MLSADAPTSLTRKRIEGLDVLRGVAVGLVMLRHAFPSYFPGAGIVGVTMFFALSGYLITGLLAKDIDRHGAPRWGRFYAHRAFRLFPALVGLLAAYLLVELIWSPISEPSELPATMLMGLTYTSDLPLPWHMADGLTHLWSLAVEEQFYLVWPLLLWCGVRAGVPAGRVAAGAAVVLTGVCWLTLVLADAPESIYERPTSWASAMALGAAGYCYRDRLEAALRPALRVAAPVALVLLALLSLAVKKEAATTYLLAPTLIAVATLVLIAVTRRWQTVTGPILRPLFWLGTISYGAYLWNLPIVHWFGAGVDAGGAAKVLTVPLTIGAAAVSWFTVEALGRSWRRSYDHRRSLADDRASVA